MVTSFSRRSVLGGAAMLTASALVSRAFAAADGAASAIQVPDMMQGALSTNEGFWADVAQHYDVIPHITNLENGS